MIRDLTTVHPIKENSLFCSECTALLSLIRPLSVQIRIKERKDPTKVNSLHRVRKDGSQIRQILHYSELTNF